VGRDYNSIHRTTGTFCVIADTDEEALAKVPDAMKARYGEGIRDTLVGSPETIRKRIAAYEAVGVHELILIFLDKTNLDDIRRFAKEYIG
jgi:alkanesulfonate monooxygenase SsuD/methylene tetrahydromethanopterin reductase-like flavin-dependent oxidoreductase (luciferase family)